jgi:hypothetical protein
VRQHNQQTTTKGYFWRDPTFHFVIIGLAIFILQGLFQEEFDEDNTIHINQRIKDEMRQIYLNQYNRSPTQNELDDLVSAWVDDELIYRRGLSLGPVNTNPTAPALRVAPEKAPLGVARRSFGMTKLHSSRLDWRLF